jgi:hypothetical protein
LSGKPQAARIHLGKSGHAGRVLLSIALKPSSLPIQGTLTSKQFTPVGSEQPHDEGRRRRYPRSDQAPQLS